MVGMVCPFFGAGTLESTGNSIIIFITINVRGASVLIPSGTLQRHSRKYLSQSSLDPTNITPWPVLACVLGRHRLAIMQSLLHKTFLSIQIIPQSAKL